MPENHKTREPITIFVGPMRSRKTTMTISELDAAEACGREVMVFKPNIDTRFGQNEIRSRGGGCHSAISIPIDKPEQILQLVSENPSHVDLAAIDEVQFFSPRIGQVVKTLANAGTAVVACGLNKNFKGNAFPAMEKLLPIAKVVTVEAKCMFPLDGPRLCGADAHHTQRLKDGQPDHYNSPVVVIEDVNQPSRYSYEARCDEHWQVPGMPKGRLPALKK